MNSLIYPNGNIRKTVEYMSVTKSVNSESKYFGDIGIGNVKLLTGTNLSMI